MDNMGLLLEETERSRKWQEEYNELVENGTKEEIIEFLRKTNVKELYTEDNYIQLLIFLYTLNDCFYEFQDVKNILLENFKNYIFDIDEINNEKFNCKELVIKTIKGDVHVFKLSKIISNIREIFIKDENIDVETLDRKGKCFLSSFKISNNLGIKNDLVTAYIYGKSDKDRYVHSFVETKLHNMDFVIDFTQNAIIDKEGYYRIKNIKENEVLERISDDEIQNDIKKYGEILDCIDFRIDTYNIFRDEFINDFERIENNFKKRGALK